MPDAPLPQVPDALFAAVAKLPSDYCPSNAPALQIFSRGGEGLGVGFPLLRPTLEQDAVIGSHPEGSRARAFAVRQVQAALHKHAYRLRDTCAGVLRAAGFEVVDEPSSAYIMERDLQVAPVVMHAVPVRYGSATTPEQEAWVAGVEDGWSHRNYEEAYGKQPGGGRPQVPLRFDGGRGVKAAYVQGWREGRRRYRRGLFTDGAPIQ